MTLETADSKFFFLFLSALEGKLFALVGLAMQTDGSVVQVTNSGWAAGGGV